VNNNNCIGPNQLVALAGILSIVIARKLNLYELSLASCFFSALGDNFGIISTQIGNMMEQQENVNSNGNGGVDNNKNGASSKDIEALQIQIDQLKCYIENLESKIDC